MSLFHEAIKDLLIDVDNFLRITLKDAELDSEEEQGKEFLIGKLEEFLQSYPQLLPDTAAIKEDDMASANNSGGSYDSSGESDCPPIAAIDLRPTLAGWLNKKRKPGVKAKLGAQRRWCCIKDGYFYYYLKDVATKPQGRFFLQGYKLYPKITEQELYLELEGEGLRKFEFDTKDKHLFDYWIEGIKAGINAAASISPPAKANVPENGTSKGFDTTDLPLDDDRIYEDVPAPPPRRRPPSPPRKPFSQPPDDIYDDGSSSSQTPSSRPISAESDDYIDPILPSDADAIYDDTLVDNGVVLTQADMLKICPPSPEISHITPALMTKPKNIAKSLEDRIKEAQIVKAPQPPTKPKGALMPPRGKQANMVKAEKVHMLRSSPPQNPKKENIYQLLYFTQWDFTGRTNDELSVRRGDVIKIIDRTFEKDSWWTGECDGKIGLVPKSYLIPVYQEDKE